MSTNDSLLKIAKSYEVWEIKGNASRLSMPDRSETNRDLQRELTGTSKNQVAQENSYQSASQNVQWIVYAKINSAIGDKNGPCQQPPNIPMSFVKKQQEKSSYCRTIASMTRDESVETSTFCYDPDQVTYFRVMTRAEPAK